MGFRLCYRSITQCFVICPVLFSLGWPAVVKKGGTPAIFLSLFISSVIVWKEVFSNFHSKSLHPPSHQTVPDFYLQRLAWYLMRFRYTEQWEVFTTCLGRWGRPADWLLALRHLWATSFQLSPPLLTLHSIQNASVIVGPLPNSVEHHQPPSVLLLVCSIDR